MQVLEQRKRVASVPKASRTKESLEEVLLSRNERERNIDLYSHQVQEIEAARLRRGRGGTAAAERYQRGKDILSLAQTYEPLYGGDHGTGLSIIDGLGQWTSFLFPSKIADERIAAYSHESCHVSLKEIKGY